MCSSVRRPRFCCKYYGNEETSSLSQRCSKAPRVGALSYPVLVYPTRPYPTTLSYPTRPYPIPTLPYPARTGAHGGVSKRASGGPRASARDDDEGVDFDFDFSREAFLVRSMICLLLRRETSYRTLPHPFLPYPTLPYPI